MTKSQKTSGKILKDELILLKQQMLSTNQMYKKLSLNKDLVYDILIKFGGKYLKPKYKKGWTPNNPTNGYCYRLTGAVYKNFINKKLHLENEENNTLNVMHVKNVSKDVDHYFFIYCDNYNSSFLIDLTREQFENSGHFNSIYEVPYEEATKAHSNTLKNFINAEEQTEFEEHFWKEYSKK